MRSSLTRKPRISKRYLAKHARGLTGLSGCLAGELCEYLMARDYGQARRIAAQYQDIFGRGNFYLEMLILAPLMRNG